MEPLSIIRGLVFAGFVLWLLIYWQGGSLIAADILRALRAPRTKLDAVLLISIAVDSMIVLVTGLLVVSGVLPIAPTFDGLSLAGAVLALLGIWGTFYARGYLGQAWTARTRVDEEQGLVETGPYGLVRHPIYSAAILLYLGLGLLFPVWWNGLAVASIVLGYVLKTSDEDRYLQECLLGYHAYARRVRYRLAPGIW
jgi:protein-S-isoprenylcysteine O-methyltransferase Ste14